MAFTLQTTFVAVAIVGGMLLFLAIGHFLRARWRRGAPPESEEGAGKLDAAVFALLGLLLGFTFSGAMDRFDHRRELAVTEANAIGTAYLRLDLLPADAQPELRTLFREYVESRLATYRKLPDVEAAMAEAERTKALQGDIWRRATSAARATGSSAAELLVAGALNPMIDAFTARLAATRFHAPPGVFGLLVAFALAASLVAGFSLVGSLRQNGLHVAVFAVVFAVSIHAIIDLEYPRLGLIRVDAADVLLVEVLRSMR